MVMLVRPPEVMVPTLPALVKPVADVGVNAVEVITWYVPGVDVAVNVNVSAGSSVNCRFPAGFETVAGVTRFSSCSTHSGEDRQRCLPELGFLFSLARPLIQERKRNFDANQALGMEHLDGNDDVARGTPSVRASCPCERRESKEYSMRKLRRAANNGGRRKLEQL